MIRAVHTPEELERIKKDRLEKFGKIIKCKIISCTGCALNRLPKLRTFLNHEVQL
jgi:hypothetical protein